MAATETNGNGAASLPLEGVRVLDFTQVMMGPCCTQMLGDYGADVIKIERAGMGDLSRWSVGEDPDGGNNPVFASLNRNKRSLALDLKSEADRETVRRLVETADVVVNNFRPGVMERMGFGYEDLKRINPAHHLGDGVRLRERRPVRAQGQGRPGRARPGDDGGHAPPVRPGDPPFRLSHRARGLRGRHAPGAGDPACAPPARAHGRGPEDLGLPLQLHARDADAGSRDAPHARARAQLGGVSRCPASSRPRTARS